MRTLYDFTATTLAGEQKSLGDFRGRVLMIVNTASRCGFTPQYAGLEQLHAEFNDRGFAVLGFPCNQFGKQEPGEAGDIQTFCRVNYGVTFPMFGKIEVNGKDAHPLYKYLKHERPGIFGSESIKWNFTKFLVDRAGTVIARFGSRRTPESLRQRVEGLL